MKTIVTTPSTVAKEGPGFIKDQLTSKPEGKDIGELVAGKREPLLEHRRKAKTRRDRTGPRGV